MGRKRREAARDFMENSELNQMVCPRFQRAEWEKNGSLSPHGCPSGSPAPARLYTESTRGREEGFQPPKGVKGLGKEARDFIN